MASVITFQAQGKDGGWVVVSERESEYSDVPSAIASRNINPGGVFKKLENIWGGGGRIRSRETSPVWDLLMLGSIWDSRRVVVTGQLGHSYTEENLTCLLPLGGDQQKHFARVIPLQDGAAVLSTRVRVKGRGGERRGP